MDECAVQIAIHFTSSLDDAQVISLALLERAFRGCQGGFRAAYTLLDGMLSVVPSSQVPPDVVSGVVVSKGDEEPFITAAFDGIELDGPERLPQGCERGLGILFAIFGERSMRRL